MEFSTITQQPEIRALVQDRTLERAFHDALFPALLFRGEAAPKIWPANVGDSLTFSGAGLIKPKMKPLKPGTDPVPSTYAAEQWVAMLQQYADSIDTYMPNSIVAIANLFLRNAQQLGMSAGQSINRVVRDRAYNAALAGASVADGAQNATASLRVKRLNGFTTSRRPDLVGGSAVRFDTVSGANPLAIKVTVAGVPTARNVIGFTPDEVGDEIGPGVLALDVAVTVVDRAPVVSDDHTVITRVGGGDSIDAIGSMDLLTLAAIRTMVARFRTQNVPAQPDGRFHCHLDPTSESQIYADAEFQRLLTSLPDYYMYRDFAIGELLGTVFFRNNENPLPETVDGGLTASWSDEDPFGGELWTGGTTAGIKVHRPIFFGQGGVLEYYQELSALITEAGVMGKVGEPSITNNGIEVYADRIQLILRAPQNRLQDMVATSWKFIGDWPVRTDAATGDQARYKRVGVIEHGE